MSKPFWISGLMVLLIVSFLFLLMLEQQYPTEQKTEQWVIAKQEINQIGFQQPLAIQVQLTNTPLTMIQTWDQLWENTKRKTGQKRFIKPFLNGNPMDRLDPIWFERIPNVGDWYYVQFEMDQHCTFRDWCTLTVRNVQSETYTPIQPKTVSKNIRRFWMLAQVQSIDEHGQVFVNFGKKRGGHIDSWLYDPNINRVGAIYIAANGESWLVDLPLN